MNEMTVDELFDLAAYLKTKGLGSKKVKAGADSLVSSVCGYEGDDVVTALDGSSHFGEAADLSAVTAVVLKKI